MEYHKTLLALFLLLGLFYALYLLFSYLYERSNLRRIDKLPFPPSYEEIIKKTPHYEKLSKEQKERIKKLILRFIHTKTFLGARGFVITQEVKVLIAFYASLLVLNLPRFDSYRSLKQVIVYPHTLISEEIAAHGGIYTQERFLLGGLSINDTVILSWHEAKKSAYHLHHSNLMLHEFAHEVDFMQGDANGVPPLQEAQYKGFIDILSKTYKRLCKKANTNRFWKEYKLLGRYAATNEAEFFAVATERFFEKPDVLKEKFPALYKQLKDFYGIETASGV
jgi:hypothetical protein